MKAFTSDTYGRNLYVSKPKEHNIPKSSKDRKGSRSSMRHRHNIELAKELRYQAQ